MIITHLHCQKLGYCMKSVRPFLESNGIDWMKFVREGIPEEELLKIDDYRTTRIVEFAHKLEESK